MILVQNDDVILSEYKTTFSPNEEVDALRQTYWLGCYSADEPTVIENLPPPPFGLIVEAPTSGNLHQLWFDTFKNLIRAGLVIFHSYGPRSEELHDIFDSADLALHLPWDPAWPREDDTVLMSTWNVRLPEAIEIHEALSHFEEPSHCVVLSLCQGGGTTS